MALERLPAGWHPVPACDLCGGRNFAPYLMRSVDGRQLDRCTSCGLVFLNPQPDESVIASWYGEDYFTSDAPGALGSQHLAIAAAGAVHGTESFRQLARRRKLRDLRIVEIGCGGGAFLAQCAAARAKVSGLELSRFAAGRLRTVFGFDVQVGSVDDHPFREQSFDAVAFTDVLEHVLAPSKFLVGLKRLIQPKGFLYGVLPNLDCVPHYGPSWGGFRHHAEHLYYFGREQIVRYLDQCGFRLADIWTYGEPWEPSPESGSGQASSGSFQRFRNVLRRVPGALPAVRSARSALSGLRRETRSRRARYLRGLGHDLFFIAELK